MDATELALLASGTLVVGLAGASVIRHYMKKAYARPYEGYADDIRRTFIPSAQIDGLIGLYFDDESKRFKKADDEQEIDTNVVGQEQKVVRPVHEERRAQYLSDILSAIGDKGRELGANAFSFIEPDNHVHGDFVYGVLYHTLSQATPHTNPD